jgi:clathrin heavy chain
LTQRGLDVSLFRFGNVTFESQKYICVKSENSVAIVDTTQGFNINKRDMKAESILMHRERNFVAVRVTQGDQTVIQVFDIDASSKLKEASVPDTVVFWHWVQLNTLALVGSKAVYHLDISDANATPQKIFDRVPDMAGCTIMNYDMEPSGKWCYLVGLYQANGQIGSKMQLYNIERK